MYIIPVGAKRNSFDIDEGTEIIDENVDIAEDEIFKKGISGEGHKINSEGTSVVIAGIVDIRETTMNLDVALKCFFG